MTEMTMLERAAKTLHAASRDMGGSGAQWDWDDPTFVQVKATYVGLMRPVLLAIREPSAAVLQAMRNTVPVDGHERDHLDQNAVKHWQAMVDAALAEGVE